MKNRPNRTAEAYTWIRDRIATGELAPGEVVSEASLAKELGLSRTPIGEALRRLSHDGLVEQVPRYGTIVRKISASELRELFEIREALEGMAASKAASRIDDATLGELSALCSTIDAELEHAQANDHKRLAGRALQRFLAADMTFHTLIIASAGNGRLVQLSDNTRSISSVMNAQRGEHPIARIRSANEAHWAIHQALVQRDPDAAQRLVVDHIRMSCEQSLRARSLSQPSTLEALSLPASVRDCLESTP